MANVFTTNFMYRGSTYSALVTTRKFGEDIQALVHITDNDLYHLLPEGELQLYFSNRIKRVPTGENATNKELIQVIRSAVIQKVKGSVSSKPY